MASTQDDRCDMCAFYRPAQTKFLASSVLPFPVCSLPSEANATRWRSWTFPPESNLTFRKVHKPLKRKGQRNKGAEGQREGTYIALVPLDPLILCPLVCERSELSSIATPESIRRRC
jgi:hypothetical protein